MFDRSYMLCARFVVTLNGAAKTRVSPRGLGDGELNLREPSVATGLYILPDGRVMVAFGARQIPLPRAQYQANGYKPSFKKLLAKSPPAVNEHRTSQKLSSRSPRRAHY
jgi:hypothetical protein